MEITTEPSFVIFASSSGLLVSRGRLTVTPCCSKGVITIKMISRTSIISTIGVTFISELNSSELPVLIPIINSPRSEYYVLYLLLQLLGALFDKEVNQFRRRVVHLDHKA